MLKGLEKYGLRMMILVPHLIYVTGVLLLLINEHPLDSNHDGTYSQYVHGGVSVMGDKLSFGLVFRYVMGEVTYSPTIHRMRNNIPG